MISLCGYKKTWLTENKRWVDSKMLILAIVASNPQLRMTSVVHVNYYLFQKKYYDEIDI